MARKTTTTTPPTPTRTPRKPAKASQVAQDGKKGITAQGRPSGRKAKGTANPFDTIAKMAADGASTADLADQLQRSLDQAKAKPVITKRQAKQVGKELATERQQAKAKGGKPRSANAASAKSDGKVDAKAKPTSTYKGRPTSNVETIAQRAKGSGLRPRRTADGNFDVDGIATRLRATPAAVREWLGSRNARPTAPAKPAKPAAPAKPAKPEAAPKAPSIRLRHVWVDREPDWLKGRVLVYSYTVDPTSGHVTSQLQAIHDANGVPVPNFKDYPADFRPMVETLGNGRKLVLKDRTMAGLETWLAKEGLTEQQ